MTAILDVGQCGFDHGNIAAVLTRALGAEVDGADSQQEAVEKMAKKKYDLVLVNRVMDADGASGVGFIQALKLAGNLTPVMLVSNYPDAQAAAVQAGAMPGFGKAELRDSEVIRRIKGAMEGAGGVKTPGENTLLQGGVGEKGPQHP